MEEAVSFNNSTTACLLTNASKSMLFCPYNKYNYKFQLLSMVIEPYLTISPIYITNFKVIIFASRPPKFIK